MPQTHGDIHQVRIFSYRRVLRSCSLLRHRMRLIVPSLPLDWFLPSSHHSQAQGLFPPSGLPDLASPSKQTTITAVATPSPKPHHRGLYTSTTIAMTASWSLSKRCWRAQAQRRQPGFLHRALEDYTCKQVLCALALIHVVLLLLFQRQVPDVYMVSECRRES